MYSKASLTRSPNSFRWYSNDSASGCTWITTEDVWSADSQTLNANSLGSCSSTSPNMTADHAAYASALPGLIRDLLIMMNGPDIGSPSNNRTPSTLGAGARPDIRRMTHSRVGDHVTTGRPINGCSLMPVGHSSSRPARRARSATWARRSAPSLCKMRDTWVPTVRVLTSRMSAIWAL